MSIKIIDRYSEISYKDTRFDREITDQIKRAAFIERFCINGIYIGYFYSNVDGSRDLHLLSAQLYLSYISDISDISYTDVINIYFEGSDVSERYYELIDPKDLMFVNKRHDFAIMRPKPNGRGYFIYVFERNN